MKTRTIVSMTLFISFILLVVTSIILYIVPHGRVAYWSDWHLWGLSKNQWGDLHINLGFLFLFTGILHIYFNWRPLLAAMKNKARQIIVFTPHFNIALILTLLICIGTVLKVPPMSTVINLAESIKDQAAEKYGEPPYGHAELSSLKLFARRLGLDMNMAMTLLKQKNISFSGPDQTILDIAKENHLTPKQVYEIIKPALQSSQQKKGLPDIPPLGFGHRSLADICTQYHIDMPKILQNLTLKKIKANPKQTIKEIAAANEMDPHSLFMVLHDICKR